VEIEHKTINLLTAAGISASKELGWGQEGNTNTQLKGVVCAQISFSSPTYTLGK
jgi:hypothetical protein